jgi:hypothetical protein
MENEELSAKEKALLAEARREAAARTRSAGAQPEAKLAPTAAERLAQLMAEERAESERRKKKMRRTGIIGAASVLALFALWVLRASRPRR